MMVNSLLMHPMQLDKQTNKTNTDELRITCLAGKHRTGTLTAVLWAILTVPWIVNHLKTYFLNHATNQKVNGPVSDFN